MALFWLLAGDFPKGEDQVLSSTIPGEDAHKKVWKSIEHLCGNIFAYMYVCIFVLGPFANFMLREPNFWHVPFLILDRDT